MSKRDYYDVLGVNKKATNQEIKQAYRKLAKQYHPDRNKETGAETKFKEVQEAYDILSDSSKRSAYDQYGFAGAQGFGGGGANFGGFDFGGGGLDDIFEQFFGGGFGGFTASQQSRGGRRGADIEVTLRITFLEAVFGGNKVINYKRQAHCDSCSGTGAEKGDLDKCKTCNGSGQVLHTQSTFFGQIQTATICPTCRGEGSIPKVKCGKCGGVGLETVNDSFEMKIPAGIPDSVTLKFAGRGQAGAKKGGFGDLYINIEVEADSRLERQGDDIYSEQRIDVVTAVLGGDVTVPTVHGELKLKIPEGSQPDKIIKLSGKGGPKFKNPNSNGDQYVRLKVEIPTSLTKQQREIWQQLQGSDSGSKGWFGN